MVLLRPARTAAEAFFLGSLVILLVADPQMPAGAIGNTLAAAYRLSRGEAKLIDALVGGLKLKQVASRDRVSVETVRSQLRDVLGKMGLHGQTDAVRAALRSPCAYLRA